jgi:hypothetical protein
MLNPNATGATTAEYLADLVCELLDAHADTILLATAEESQALLDEVGAWTAHMDYLRDLQRVGHEALAHIPAPALYWAAPAFTAGRRDVALRSARGSGRRATHVGKGIGRLLCRFGPIAVGWYLGRERMNRRMSPI